MRCVINTLFRWNPMKLVTYYLEGVIKETKQFCVLEKVFSCDLQTRNQQAAFWENSGFLLSVKIGFFRDRGSIVKSFGNWNYLTNLWDMCWYCFPRPPRELTCVWIPAKLRSTFFQITVGRANCDVLTSADPSCWSDRSWGASWWTAVGFILTLGPNLSSLLPDNPKDDSTQSNWPEFQF